LFTRACGRTRIRKIEGKRFTGHYTNAFGSLDDMLAGRDELVRLAGLARSPLP
jgi:hypothetical protein